MDTISSLTDVRRRLARWIHFGTITITFSLLMIVAIASSAWSWSAAPATGPQFFRIGTGPTTGQNLQVGALISSVVSNPPGSRPCEQGGSCGAPNVIAVAQATESSIQWLRDLANLRIESGLVQADVASLAFQGKGPFARGRLGNLRAIAGLYPEYLHVVIGSDARIRSFSDLKGKRVSLDLQGSDTRIMMQLILPQLGVRISDITVSSLATPSAANQFKEHRLDAFVFESGLPAEAVQRLSSDLSIALLPVPPVAGNRIARSTAGLLTGEIPANVYKTVSVTPTLMTELLWVVPAETDDNLVYALTRALWNPGNRRLLDASGPLGRSMHIERALIGLTIPLHPGAERFYKESGYDFTVPAGQPSSVVP